MSLRAYRVGPSSARGRGLARRGMILVGLLWAWGGCPGACDSPPLPSELELELERLHEGSLVPPEARAEDGSLRSLRLRWPVAQGSDPVEAAMGFLAEFPALTGIDDPHGTLSIERVVSDPFGGHQVFFRQRVGKVPLYASQLSLHIDSGHIALLQGNYLLGLPQAREPGITQAQARGLALAAVGQEVAGAQLLGPPALAYVAPQLIGGPAGAPTLSWRVPVRGLRVKDMSPGSWQVFLDADDGAMRLFVPEHSEHAPSPRYEISTAQNNEGCPPAGALWFDSAGQVTGTTPSLEGSDAYAFAQQTYAYYQTTFDRHGWDGAEGAYRVYVHVGVGWQNAQYRPDCDMLAFGDGQADLGGLAHEYYHGVDRYTAGLVYQNESGALDESYADIAEALVDAEDWLLGEDLGLGGCGALRSMSNPPDCGHPDHLSDFLVTTADSGGVHTNSSIPNKAFFLMTQGGSHRGVSVAGIGRGKSGPLAYYTHTTRLGSGADFMAARDATIAQAYAFLDGRQFRFTAADVCSVVNAFEAVGLGVNNDHDCDRVRDAEDLDDDNDLIPDRLDNCPLDRNPRQADLDGDGVGDVCDPDRDGDGVADGDDNCPEVANADQLNSFGGEVAGDVCDDQDGDSVVDAADNCVRVNNPGQENADGDSAGDACDTNDDNDAVVDAFDNCRTVPNDDQADSDADGVGEACDNCPSVGNPGQQDLDGDGVGDLCDADIDADGLPNDGDSCPYDYDPNDLDVDGNGVGLVCDGAEVGMLDGSFVGALKGALQFLDGFRPVRLPIAPCLADGCPDWFSQGDAAGVTLVSGWELQTRVVDSLGRQVGLGREVGTGQALEKATRFPVAGDTFYRDPFTGEAVEGTGYFLEVSPPAGFGKVAPPPIPVEITVSPAAKP